MTVAVRQFRAAGTNVETPKPATTIVTHGIYRLSRNPMYVSLTLLQAAIGVAAGSLWIVTLLAPTLAVMRYGVIAREERYMERKFGAPYLAYKASVRRWL
jgi:protein-S-isoprenylcysteine O-methyltransferase Ste14